MNPLSGAARQLKALKRLPLVRSIDSARWAALEPLIGFRQLEEHESLFAAGRESDTLYLVVDGELALHLPGGKHGGTFHLQSRTSGATAGDFAVLNGGAHLVSAIATGRTRVATLPRSAFDLLTDVDPEILAHVYDTAAELSRRVTLARVFLNLFGALSPELMQRLLEVTSVHHYRSGEVIFEEGDEADGLHCVVSGRVVVESRYADGTLRCIAQVSAPESVGELALLSGRTRSATVTAARESSVAMLPREHFAELIASDPSMLLSLSRLVVRRQTDGDRRPPGRQRRVPDRTFVVVPLDTTLPLRHLLVPLKRALREHGEPLILDSRSFDTLYGKTGASQTRFQSLFNPAIAEWLDDKEERFDTLVYVADRELTPWTLRALNRADRILLIADPKSDDSALRPIETALDKSFAGSRTRPRTELVLLHPRETQQPADTLRWLEPRRLDDYHHVRMDDVAHTARLARRLVGKARGIVFSGGGARGYAHLGVQRLIEEREIEIDCIGGSSMGALLGAAMAMGQDHEAVYDLSARFANKSALFDYTLPIASLMKSTKLTRFCRSIYGDAQIEDLWTPFFAISSNLADGKTVTHDRGALWQVVRSTVSLPGLFSPMPTPNGDLLIDGAVLDSFPVDAMCARLGGGEIVGVNVSRVPERFQRYHYGSSVSGWRVLWSRLAPWIDRIEVPRLAETLLRATDIKDRERLDERRARIDVLIEPDVSRWALLDFKHFAAISDVGYRAAAGIFDAAGLVGNGTLAEAESVAVVEAVPRAAAAVKVKPFTGSRSAERELDPDDEDVQSEGEEPTPGMA